MKALIRIRPREGDPWQGEKRFLASMHGKRGNVVAAQPDALTVEDESELIISEEWFRIIEE